MRAGKSTLMRMLYGNYLCQVGSIRIAGTELVGAAPRQVLALRRETLGYVSQFLRVVPRVPTLDVVADPLLALGTGAAEARERAGELLARLRIPETLWTLSPTTFSGGEQQRVNIARGFIHPYPAMLLDEPTASLDPANRETVLRLIEEAKARGAAIVGIFCGGARARCEPTDRCVGFRAGAGGMSGRLVAVVGPSGVGKDTVMRALAQAVPGLGCVRRVITRPPEPGGEDHAAVTEADFRTLADRGAFLLHWEAHGLHYGIPVEVVGELAQGRDMLANLSRSVLARAAEKVPRLEVVALDANREALAARLAARGRETADQIAARLSRGTEPLPEGLTIHRIDNSGALPATVADIRAQLYPESVTP